MSTSRRAAKWLLLAVVVVIGAGLAFLGQLASRPRPRLKQWLMVSAPSFESRTNTQGISETVYFIVSNAGPRTLEFGLPWYECRGRIGLPVLATSVKTNPGGYVYGYFGLGKPTSLRPREVRQIRRDLAPVSSASADRLFCAEVDWIGHDSLLKKGEDLIIWGLGVFSVHWKPRCEPACGKVFTSNTKIPDFFQVVYGVKGNVPLDELNEQWPRFDGFDGLIGVAAQTACEMSRVWTNASEQAEPNAASSAAPPHR